MQVEIAESSSAIEASAWDALAGGSPLLSHAFLSALEDTGCVGQGTGWQANPLLVREDGVLVGAVPLYLKGHSYGEYVFDWAWADAYERSGQRYYPKLLAAIPFTPITGARLLSADAYIHQLMAQVVAEQLPRHGLSSAHVLFPDEASAEVLRAAGWIERNGVQFRWQNEGFADFEGFLARLAHDKRKKIRQERRRVREAGIECRQLIGNEISEADWDLFYDCYVTTYRQHHSTPYLTRSFFSAIAERMPQHLLLIVAERGGRPIAAALNIYDRETLNGRYWGALEYVPGLHFELCYYQAQEFCIRQGIRYFEGGAQGEHKLARGFAPRPTCSFHRIAHPDFEAAIRDFVKREAQGIALYHDELTERAPYKKLAEPDA